MTVFATVRSLLDRLMYQLVRPAPAPRVRWHYPRSLCPTCGRMLAQTSRGAYRHQCRPAVTQADPMRRPTAGPDLLGQAELGPSAGKASS